MIVGEGIASMGDFADREEQLKELRDSGHPRAGRNHLDFWRGRNRQAETP